MTIIIASAPSSGCVSLMGYILFFTQISFVGGRKRGVTGGLEGMLGVLVML